jgi:hypothetical protein
MVLHANGSDTTSCVSYSRSFFFFFGFHFRAPEGTEPYVARSPVYSLLLLLLPNLSAPP